MARQHNSPATLQPLTFELGPENRGAPTRYQRAPQAK
jgi:hypothetical protein